MLEILFYFRVFLVVISWLAGLMLFCRIKTVNKVETGRNYLQNRRVSIIIPARNEEKNIPFILKSLENQTYNNFEVRKSVLDDIELGKAFIKQHMSYTHRKEVAALKKSIPYEK